MCGGGGEDYAGRSSDYGAALRKSQPSSVELRCKERQLRSSTLSRITQALVLPWCAGIGWEKPKKSVASVQMPQQILKVLQLGTGSYLHSLPHAFFLKSEQCVSMVAPGGDIAHYNLDCSLIPR